MKLEMTDIHNDDGKLIARILSGRTWPEGIHFHTDDEQNIQVATMNYAAGVHMKAHKHNTYGREVYRTGEVFCVISGSVDATILDEDGKVLEHILLRTGDVAILVAGGHAFDVLEDKTQILEVKNGPFFGVEKDKTFFE